VKKWEIQILIVFLVMVFLVIAVAGWRIYLLYQIEIKKSNKENDVVEKGIRQWDVIIRWAIAIGVIANLIYVFATK
jgi:hypothetical protein